MTFHAHDIRWFSELVHRLYAAADERELFGVLLPELHAHFRAGVTGIEEVAYNMSAYRLHGLAGGAAVPHGYLAALEDGPLVVRWRMSRPSETMHLSQMESRRVLRRTTFYNVICRALQIEDQLIGTFGTAEGVALNFSVNRGAPFSERERVLMEHVRRHVRAGHARLRRTSAPFSFLERPEVELDAVCRPRGLSPEVMQLLTGYFPAERKSVAQGNLPESISRWVAGSLLQLCARPPVRPLIYHRTESPRGALVVRLFTYPEAGYTLRFSEDLPRSSLLPLGGASLTGREREVLDWLSIGKRDGEIGVILGCRARTVEKHVENIRRKLGADSRTGASAAAAWCGPAVRERLS